MVSRTRPTLVWCFLCIGICSAGWGCNPPVRSGAPDPEQTEASTDFDANKRLFAEIGKADQLTLFEGLPHQRFEADKLVQEQRDKPTLTLHGFPFYKTPLDVVPEDVGRLKEVLGTEGSFRPWIGEKKCGGFHPDYLAEWQGNGSVYRVLICLGCCEVMVFGPDRSLRADLAFPEKARLEELLKKYRQHRPPKTGP